MKTTSTAPRLPLLADAQRWPSLLAAAAFLWFLLPGLLGSYGIFIDEHYYLACSKRLAWGYVDHPPLAPAMLRVSRLIFGDTIWALRVPAALLGALMVWMTSTLARRLGAGGLGQVLAGVAVMIATVPQVFFGMFSMNALALVIWLGCAWLLVEIELRDQPRLWLAFGALAGIGLLNKHTMVLFALGLALALPFTRARRHLASPWLWAGAGLAGLLLAPNLAWQAAHDWPSLEFYHNADLYKNQPTPAWQVAAYQLLIMNPGTLPLWLGGVYYFLFTERGRACRHLGLTFVVLFALMVISHKSRPDRIAGVYAIMFAAGAAHLDIVSRQAGRRWLRWALPAFVAAFGLLLAPLGVPVLPPEQLAAYSTALGVVPKIERGAGKRSELPQWFADRLGWEALAADVDAALAAADFGADETIAIFAPRYGQAGALELLRARPGYPPVYSTHNNYFLWGPPPPSVTAGLVIGDDREHLSELFETVELMLVHRCGYCMRWRDQMPIWKVERPKRPLPEVWPGLKRYE